MIYYGYITEDAKVIIIGADKHEVNFHYRTGGLGESHIQEKKIAKFTCSENLMIILIGFEINTAIAKAIKEEVAILKAKEKKTVVRVYSDVISALTISTT